ncbi:hypothetical protein [Flavobacterium sp.]|uniref:hypothetical protein n=1 Tax=Flavobacterium sp. TaxID=239 RepID=UPI00262C5022|nr:hypothetical protein [Flavobacterium sp.]
MTDKNIHPDQLYIDGLLQNNSNIIQSIYKKFAPKVKSYIRTNSGDDDQAQDVIQEVLKLSFVTKTMEEVAEKLNVTYGYVRKKKSLCTGQLTEMIQQSNRYKSLKY